MQVRFRVARHAPIALALIAALLVPSGCASVAAYKPGMSVAPTAGAEERLWASAEDADRAIARSGQVYSDTALESYLNDLMRRLFPEHTNSMHVRVLKAPVLNAFAMPNGSVYVNTGLLASVENESQLASVLGHEGTHFVNRHSLQQYNTVVVGQTFAIGIAMLGVPLVGDLIAMGGIAGYTRGLESEADREGFVRLRNAGYQTAQGARAFELLAIEAKALDDDVPFFFSSHPQLLDRIANYHRMDAANGLAQGRVNSDEFNALMPPLRAYALQQKIAAGMYKPLIAAMQDPALASMYGALGQYYLGEAYRLRAEKGDEAQARTAYQHAVDSAELPAAHYGLGVLAVKADNKEEARKQLGAYLQAQPEGENAAFARQLLDQVDQHAQ